MTLATQIIRQIAIVSNILSFLGFGYAMTIYNKSNNPKKLHYFSVVLVTALILYLLTQLLFGAKFLYLHEPIIGLSFTLFALIPFIIGICGNNYKKAKLYFALQLLSFLLSLFLLFYS